ncbi:protein-tyrosine-phosphatase, partial [Georgenia ruanii]|nr:protein-tyrosine-phosphatase [Georgenia ruanii]
MLYRSDVPHDGDADPAHVPHWPPATVVDLRTEREAERTSYALRGAERVPYPLHGAAAPDSVRGSDLGAIYRHILESVPERVAAAVGIVVSSPAPVLVHCTAGKDRTGIVIGALLLAAGVAPVDVLADYLRTADNMDAVVQRVARRARPGARPLNPAWLLTPAEAFTEVIKALTLSAHGDVRGWLCAHGTRRDRLDEWAQRFVQPAVRAEAW